MGRYSEGVLDTMNNRSSTFNNSDLILSCIVGFVTFLIASTSMGPVIVKPLLIEGTIISNGRFAFVYDAYDTVEDDGSPSVVGIGSSILLAGMNGSCMQDNSEVEDARFYNFAMSGGKPYSEMIQIPALIESNPDVVIVEVGPNSLYGWNENSSFYDDVLEYNKFRLQLMSMGMRGYNQSWYNILDEIDRQWVANNEFERSEEWSEYTRDAMEVIISRGIIDYGGRLGIESYSYVPPVGSSGWEKYLSEPNWKDSIFDTMSPEEIRDYLDEKMPSKSKQGVYNPQADYTQNHRAIDYIIHELINASIEVVLIGIPHHPWVNDYLEYGQLDGMNLTYDRYNSLEGVTSLQMYWEEWPSEAYSDRNHLNAEGRKVFCDRVTPIIDAILTGTNIEESAPNNR